MKQSDAENIAAIEEMTFAMPWSRNDFWKEAINDNAIYVVGVLDNKVIAYGGVWVSFEEAQVTNIAVHPDYRSQGIGTKLFSRLIEEIKKRGVTALTLEVRPSNEAALKLYEKFNLKSVGRRKGYYLDNGEDALIMWNTKI
ncbi:MAG: ribosomal protein S18-alanine N-acetyltransferase [Selenomonadaceae bacterium]|nr:ribosomal protein S18-alanine N-acetyltransferase [Selenomonadaceae bacterium]